MPESIPEDVALFLLRHIDSVAQWEGLLLLRTQDDQPWTAARLARRLYIAEAEAEKVLESLLAQRFLRHDTAGYAYAPEAELDEAVGRAADYYARYLVPVTNLIHGKSKHRVQKFADAFRIGKGS